MTICDLLSVVAVHLSYELERKQVRKDYRLSRLSPFPGNCSQRPIWEKNSYFL